MSQCCKTPFMILHYNQKHLLQIVIIFLQKRGNHFSYIRSGFTLTFVVKTSIFLHMKHSYSCKKKIKMKTYCSNISIDLFCILPQAVITHNLTRSVRLVIHIIVNRLEWLWSPSGAFVICFCGPEGAQSSIAFLAFWSYWPIKTSL